MEDITAEEREESAECKTDFCTWMIANEPNYKTNVDLFYPYSEIPYTGQYNLVKIPGSLNDLIQHVDYFGEGRIDNGAEIIGFPNSYNVNYQYRLVSSGPDRDKKIPNRIPLVSYKDCDTSAFIRDNSVLIVTIPDTRINSSSAKDIARIINKDHGLVVAYRECFSKVEQMKPLVDELKKRGLLSSKDVILPSELTEPTFYDSHVAFVLSVEKKQEKELDENEITKLTNLLYDRVWWQDWPKSLEISRQIGKNVMEVVTKLLKLESKRVIPFAYKLWHDGAQNIVRKHFPKPYQYILDKHGVTIVDKEFDMALKMGSILNQGSQNRAIYGVERKEPKDTISMTWRFFPTCTNDDPYIAFKIRNQAYKTLFLKMSDEKVDGDAYLEGSPMSQDEVADKRYIFRLESWIADNGNVEFSLRNLHNNQRIKLEVNKTDTGDRRAWGHGKVVEMSNRLKWYIAPKSIPQ